MSEKYKIRNQDSACFVTFTVVGRIDVFTRPSYKNVIVDSLKYDFTFRNCIRNSYVNNI